MDKKLSELLRIWNQLNEQNKKDLLDYMRKAIERQNNQNIQKRIA
ncbi:MAG TPA: hypothetical protein PKE23_04095 [Anaerolineales bacterium]|nr:hypothetical protein [Anaerolineales bacterium]HNB42141.1 hypothetical protein [Anaerolineales bacterium]